MNNQCISIQYKRLHYIPRTGITRTLWRPVEGIWPSRRGWCACRRWCTSIQPTPTEKWFDTSLGPHSSFCMDRGHKGTSPAPVYQVWITVSSFPLGAGPEVWRTQLVAGPQGGMGPSVLQLDSWTPIRPLLFHMSPVAIIPSFTVFLGLWAPASSETEKISPHPGGELTSSCRMFSSDLSTNQIEGSTWTEWSLTD